MPQAPTSTVRPALPDLRDAWDHQVATLAAELAVDDAARRAEAAERIRDLVAVAGVRFRLEEGASPPLAARALGHLDREVRAGRIVAPDTELELRPG